MKLLRITFALILGFSINAYSQDDENVGSNQMLLDGSDSMMLFTGRKASDKIEGTPYLNENFEPAKVTGYEEKIYNVRYNAYADEIEVKLADGTIKRMNNSLNNMTIKTTVTNILFEPQTYLNDDGEQVKGFLVLLNPNSKTAKLFVKKSKRFVDAVPARTSYDKDKPAEFKDEDDEFFIKYGEGYPVHVPKKKKDLANIFEDNEDKVLDFIKENRIKSNKQEDLISLVNYVNSI